MVKEHTIRVRITDEMHRYIQDRCKGKGYTVSEYIREIVDKDIHDFKNLRKTKKEVKRWQD